MLVCTTGNTLAIQSLCRVNLGPQRKVHWSRSMDATGSQERRGTQCPARCASCVLHSAWLPVSSPQNLPARPTLALVSHWPTQPALSCMLSAETGCGTEVKFVPGSVLSVLSLQSSPGHATHSRSNTSICAAQKHWRCGCHHSFSTSLYACGSGPTIVRHQGLARSTSNGSML